MSVTLQLHGISCVAVQKADVESFTGRLHAFLFAHRLDRRQNRKRLFYFYRYVLETQIRKIFARFEILKTLTVKYSDLQDVTCSWLEIKRFDMTYCLHLRGKKEYTLKVVAAGSSKAALNL
jgi:hypothetical protein